MLTSEASMIESAARAGRSECASAAGFYTWETPGKPVAVAIPLALIDQMDREAVENFRSLSSRGSEIGGLLFGAVEPGNPALVTVTSYAQVVCDYGLGPLYRLSETDLNRLDEAIAQAAGSAAAPVGFFRSHTRKGISLDPADRKLLKLRFAAPHCLALLVRPSATKPSTAGIFIWENGEMQSETSYLEFPFRASELTSSSRVIPAQASRAARIVPIASRRDPAPLTREEACPIIPVVPSRVASPDTPSPRPMELGLVSKPDAATGRGRLYVFLSALAVMGVAVLFLANSGALRPGDRVVPPATAGGLSLQVERRAGDMLLRWDLHSPAIRNASQAVLEISDGPRHESIELDRTQLLNGSIAYSSTTGDVIFKMDVTGSDQSNASESLRVLSAPAPLLPPSIQRVVTQRKPENPASDTPAAAVGNDPKPAAPDASVKTAADLTAPDPDPQPTPQLISRTEPEYPEAARDAGAKGPVKVVATIGEDGKVKSVKPVSGPSLLIGPATEAILQWRYQPAVLHGVPVESEAHIVLSFTDER